MSPWGDGAGGPKGPRFRRGIDYTTPGMSREPVQSDAPANSDLEGRLSEREGTRFEKLLEELLNSTCQENASNTPDFILAQYLTGCLHAFNTAVQQRETWYGRDARPAAPSTDSAANE